MHLDVKLDILAASLGFLSSLVLLVTAIRSEPLQALLDKVAETGPKDPGYPLAMAVKNFAERDLARIRLWDPRLLYLGIGLLAASYLVSLVKDFCFSGR